MKLAALATLCLCVASAALAQQPSTSQQHEADKGVKTLNSGASGYVGEQGKGTSTGPSSPGSGSGNVANSPNAQNSGTGISGMPGSKSGPSTDKSTVGSSSPSVSAKDQDATNVKGLPGNKSGLPAKR